MRVALAAEIEGARDAVAEAVKGAPVSRHPGVEEDLGRHLTFLQAAVELDEPTVFGDHARWCRDRTGERGIDSARLIETLEMLRDELVWRVSPAAASAVRLAVREGIEALSARRAPAPGDEGVMSPACHLYVAAVVTGRREEALTIVREAVSGASSPVDVYIDIFQDALYEVGRRWQTAGLTIAEEHMATATTQFILAVLHAELPKVSEHRGAAVVTGVAGEHHAVGANIVANVLDEDGWEVRLIGTNPQRDTVVSEVRSHRASLLAISVTMASGVAEAQELIALVRASVTAPPRILVGGAAFCQDPQLWRAVAADGFAPDARSLVELARS